MAWLRQVAKASFAATDRFWLGLEGPRILIYHQVDVGRGRQMEVTLDDFKWQLDWLEANRRVVDLATALDRRADASANDMVVLTFDDGYRDTFEVAFPELREREMPFTLYIATEHLDTQSRLSGAEPLTWSQVEAMLATGLLTLGAHTHGHTDLRTIATERIEFELATSDAILEDRLGVRPRHFAYPWGYWSELADGLVRSRYDSAVLGAPAKAEEQRDPYLVHRLPIQLSDGRRWFPNRLDGGLILEERVRRRMRGYTGP